MSERFLDDLARTLAEPMPRRRAVRVVGTALAFAALPSLAPRTVRATGRAVPCIGQYPIPCGQGCCIEGGKCCGVRKDGLPLCCTSQSPVCCVQPGGQTKICCKANEQCGPVTRNEIYGNKERTCVRRCPPGRAFCRGKCCPPGQECRSGKCASPCKPSWRKCGRKCCPKSTFCCDAKNKLCCQKGTDCCNKAKPGEPEKWTCCPKGTSCAPPLGLSPSGMTTGVEKGAVRVCCPQERVVPGIRNVCCPLGHVSLGGDLILPAGGGGGLCCRKDKLCGTGQDRTCCSSGTPTVPQIETTCCSGRCVNILYDEQHCGACGNACVPGEQCVDGTCVEE